MKRMAMLLCLLLAGCATGNKSAEKPISAVWVQKDAEWQAAARNGVNLRDGSEKVLATLSPAVLAPLFLTWQKVKASSGIDAQLALARTADPNAFAIEVEGRPTVVVGLSFMDLIGNDPDAYAATLGHELAHLFYRHGETTLARTEAARGASQVLGTLLSLAGVPLGGTLVDLGVTAIATSYSRDQEREADIKGLDWATAAGFDACGSARTMKALAAAGGGSGALSFLSTHPGHDERIERASKRAGRPC